MKYSHNTWTKKGGRPPIERAIVLASKQLGIPTIVIQHGIYNSNALMFDGKYADYIFAWGQYFKDLYMTKSTRNPEDIFILGYPYRVETIAQSNKANKYYTVYYLGQNDERYNNKLLESKIKTIKELNRLCNKLGMKFIYRFHPGDDRKILKNRLPQVSFTSKNETLAESFNRVDIFISHTSTALIEAAIRAKVCIQLLNYPGIMDSFEDLGVCSKSLKTIEELESYLTKIISSENSSEFKSKFDSNYIDLSYDPGKRFLEILSQIDVKS